MEDPEAEENNQVLYCYAKNLRPLAILLSAVHFCPRANLQISEAGIHIHVEIGKTLQAHAYLEKSSFTEWRFNPRSNNSQPKPSKSNQRSNVENEEDEGEEEEAGEEEEEVPQCEFEVSMTTLIECLNIFGTASNQKSNARSNRDPLKNGFEEDLRLGRRDDYSGKKTPASAVRITYDGEGSPLVLLIEDSGVVTRCALVTYEPDEMAEMMFPKKRQVVQLIMKSDWLKSAFAQFDEKIASEITLMFSPPNLKQKQRRRRNSLNENDQMNSSNNLPSFRIEVDGLMGTWLIDFPNDKDILESFECKLPDGLDDEGIQAMGFIRNSYKLSHILKFKKALDVSSKASLRVDDTGFMSLQLLIPLDETSNLRVKKGYVEFLCVPIEDV